MDKKEQYFESTGRRKTSTARVRVFASSKSSFLVNETPANEYFKTDEERRIVSLPLTVVNDLDKGAKFAITVKVTGGGTHSQAEAVRHGLSRALLLVNGELREGLKKEGYLKRDPRAKERRKFGLKKARKAPQWSKR
ncbi:MAG: 30S ribosomal protein S9 [Candidatus Pacebacteria bacterium]|jgi:small subunit ribosomal protein S9|nr:30S ribosomal protein S9 [Candidatus Paceibacterota bacterium]